MRISRLAVFAAIVAACPTQVQAVMSDREYAAKTAVYEAKIDGKDGIRFVLWAIYNRMKCGYGETARSVVTHRRGNTCAFEPWCTKRGAIMALSPSNQSYQTALRLADAIWSGKQSDPTGGATHFWSPSAQAGFGRRDPSWAHQYRQTTRFRHHVFYRGPCRSGYRAADAPASAPEPQQVAATRSRHRRAPPEPQQQDDACFLDGLPRGREVSDGDCMSGPQQGHGNNRRYRASF